MLADTVALWGVTLKENVFFLLFFSKLSPKWLHILYVMHYEGNGVPFGTSTEANLLVNGWHVAYVLHAGGLTLWLAPLAQCNCLSCLFEMAVCE